jgi:hypothetical protein
VRIALVDTTKKPTAYPIALLKIGAWRKALGDECELFTNALPKGADEIWLTTCFTYDIPHALGIVRAAKDRAPVIKVGGIAATLLPEYFEQEGIEVHRGLIPEAEEYHPDYSLLPEPPAYSIAHTSRGCIRKCKFCMVHRLEPEFHNRDWTGDLAPGAKRILFYDNNWLAKEPDDLAHDVGLIRGLVSAGQVVSVDFNQGLDCRLLTEEKADMLAGLPIRPVRFAFDGMQEDGHYQRAVRLMAVRGFRDFMTYVLYNFTDTPLDFYYRLRASVELSMDLEISVSSFPMRFQPILEVDHDREYIGKHWTLEWKRAFVAIRAQHSQVGQVSPGDIDEFEYWFGKDADEFVRLLSYPRIRQLAARKKGALRMARAT